MGPISWTVCPWQAFTAQCNVTLAYWDAIHKISNGLLTINLNEGLALFNIEGAALSSIFSFEIFLTYFS